MAGRKFSLSKVYGLLELPLVGGETLKLASKAE